MRMPKVAVQTTPRVSLPRRFARTLVGLPALLRHVRADNVVELAEIARNLDGVFPRQCPACEFEGNFRAMGSPPRWDAKCPKCGSLERHRLFFLLMERESSVLNGARLLHFAPEPVVRSFLEGRVEQYLSADLSAEGADLKLNIEAIDLDDESFDAVVCSHVLEHVDDGKALNELYRIVRGGGVLYVMVPLIEAWDHSYEDDSICDPKQRELHFGQDDHVRYYGADLRERIRAAGFELDEFEAKPADGVRYSLLRGERIFICRKPAA